MTLDESQRAVVEQDLVRELRPRVLAFARRHLRDRQLAEDFTQEALASTLEALRDGRIGDLDRVGGWVLGTCRNLIRNHARKQARRQELAPVAQAGEPRVVDPTDPRDPWMRLAGCMMRLSERAREVLLFTYVDDLSSPSIASRLGMTPVAVRVARKRALDAVRRCLHGGADA